jgi:hypothetical protein
VSTLTFVSSQGVFPFDFQSNLLHALTGQDKVNGVLWPELNLTVRFFRRKNIDSVLERAFINETEYYGDGVHTVTNAEKITWEIKDLQILYEAVTLNSQEKMDRGKKGGKWFVDIPRIIPQSVDHGQMMTVNKVTVAKGTKAVMLTWMKSDQLFLNELSNKNLSARFRFIPNAISAKFEVAGGKEGSIYFPEGFKDLGTTGAHVSNTLRVYHGLLVAKKLYSRPFDKFVPPSGQNGYDQSIIISFTDEKLKEATEVVVTVEYNAAASPTKWYLVPTLLEQHELTYFDKQAIKSEVVV